MRLFFPFVSLCFALFSCSVSAAILPLSYSIDGQPNKDGGCISVADSDPGSFYNNYLCSDSAVYSMEALGIKFSVAGPIKGMKCTSMNIDHTLASQNINKGVANSWSDNYICVPLDSVIEFLWIEDRPVDGNWQCINFGDTGFPQQYLCNQFRLPVDCQVSEWGPFESCSVRCGKGVQSRTRSIMKQAENGGANCPINLIERQACESREGCGTNDSWFDIDTLLSFWLYCTAFNVAVFAILLILPLPGGIRHKIIQKLHSIWQENKKIHGGVIGGIIALFVFSALIVWYSYDQYQSLNTKILSDNSLDCSVELPMTKEAHQAENNFRLAATVFIAAFVALRFALLLKNYVEKAAANKDAKKTN